MLYIFCFIEILIYLFLIPVVRIFAANESPAYAFGVAFLFAFFFVFGGLLAQAAASRENHIKAEAVTQISRFGLSLLVVWVLVCMALSIEFELYFRRIGTETAAEKFSELNPVALAIFRVFEICLPYLSALVVADGIRNGWRTSRVLISGLFLILGYLSLGGADSRSQTAFLLLTIVVILQNQVSKPALRRLFVWGFSVGGLALMLVTASRLSADAGQDFGTFFSDEVLRRLDGLEVLSLVEQQTGSKLFGSNFSAVLNPIVSSLPFSEEARNFKLSALTTVKAVILDEELSSNYRDVNAFVILDVFYWGGLIGVAGAGFVVGFFARLVDRKIGLARKDIFILLLVSIASNLIVLEREAVGILLSIFRDWIILYLISILMVSRLSGTLASSVRQ